MNFKLKDKHFPIESDHDYFKLLFNLQSISLLPYDLLVKKSQEKRKIRKWATIVTKRSFVSSLRRRNRPQPSSRRARLSMLLPEKSSKQTLKTWRITCVGTTPNFVRFDRKDMFWVR